MIWQTGWNPLVTNHLYRMLSINQVSSHPSPLITYLEFQNAEAIKQCAISGIGIAFLPEITVEAEVERGDLVALPWQLSDLQVYLIWFGIKKSGFHQSYYLL